MKEWTPNSKYGGHAFGLNSFDSSWSSRKTSCLDPGYSPYLLAKFRRPTVYLHYKDHPRDGKPQKDPTHTANFGLKLQERCEELGLSCELVNAKKVKHKDATAYL